MTTINTYDDLTLIIKYTSTIAYPNTRIIAYSNSRTIPCDPYTFTKTLRTKIPKFISNTDGYGRTTTIKGITSNMLTGVSKGNKYFLNHDMIAPLYGLTTTWTLGFASDGGDIETTYTIHEAYIIKSPKTSKSIEGILEEIPYIHT